MAAASAAMRRRIMNDYITRFRSAPAEPLRQDLLHDLGRAAADGDEAGVAPLARDGELVGVAEAAVGLQAAIDGAVEELAGEELGHGDLLDRILLTVEKIDDTIGKPTRRFDLHR